jgi:translation elongation factor EF-1beta
MVSLHLFYPPSIEFVPKGADIDIDQLKASVKSMTKRLEEVTLLTMHMENLGFIPWQGTYEIMFDHKDINDSQEAMNLMHSAGLDVSKFDFLDLNEMVV